MGTPIGSPPNGIFLAQMSLLVPDAPTIDFFRWLMFGIPFVCLLIPAAWLYLTKLVYPEIPLTIPGARQVIEARMEELGRMSRAEMLTLCVFALTAAAWICSDTKEIGGVIIPGLDQIFPEINDTVIAMGGAFLLFILPSGKTGEGRLMDWKTAAGIPWGILLLFGGGLCLSAAFVKSGLAGVSGSAREHSCNPSASPPSCSDSNGQFPYRSGIKYCHSIAHDAHYGGFRSELPA